MKPVDQKLSFNLTKTKYLRVSLNNYYTNRPRNLQSAPKTHTNSTRIFFEHMVIIFTFRLMVLCFCSATFSTDFYFGFYNFVLRNMSTTIVNAFEKLGREAISTEN